MITENRYVIRIVTTLFLLLINTPSLALTYSETVLADSPVGYWKLDETTGTTAADSSGNNQNGTYGAGITLNQGSIPGDSGGAAYFDGTSSANINLNNDPSFQINTGTVIAWIKTADAGSSYRGIIVKPFAYPMFLQEDIFMTVSWGGGGAKSTGINLADDRWHMVAMTFESGVTNGTKLYIDGQVALTTTFIISGQNNNLWIGSSVGGTAQNFKGSIDEVSAYNYKLTDAQILQQYQNGEPIPPEITISSPAAGGVTNSANVTINGSVDEPVSQLTIDGVPVTVAADLSFSYAKTLTEGLNNIAFSATDIAGNVGTNNLSVTLDSSITMTYSDTALFNNPIGYWKLDETTGTTAADSSGNNQAGVYGTGVTLNQESIPGDSGGAAYFDGTSSANINLNNDPSFQISTGTVIAWIKTADAGSSYRGIIVKPYAYPMFLYDNIFYTVSWGGGGAKSTGLNLADDQWHMVAMTFESGATNGTKLYVDGQLVLTTTFIISGQNNNLWIGSSTGGTVQNFKGLIDEVSVYNYKFTASEILQQYQNGDPVPPEITIASPTAGGVTNSTNVTINGSVNEPVSELTIDGVPVTVESDLTFTHTKTLAEGLNNIAFSATDMAGNIGTKSLSITKDSNATLSYSDTVLFNSPIGYWKLDETTGTSAADSSGNNQNGTYGNSVSLNQTGIPGDPGGAAYFDGTSSANVNLNNDPSFQLNTGTAIAWIKTANAGTSYRGVIIKPYAYPMFLQYNIFITYSWGGGGAKSTGLNLADDQWHMVAMTFDSGVTNGTKLYVDGQLVLTTTFIISGQNNNLWIGSSTGGTVQNFTGMIDEVSVYNYQFTASEIQQQYNNGDNDSVPPVITITSPTDGEVTNSANVTINGSVNEPVSQLTIDGDPVTVEADLSFSYVKTLAEGLNNIAFSATDLASNIGTAALSITLDTIAPGITITDPANNAITNNPTLIINGNVNEPVSQLTIDGVPVTVAPDLTFSHTTTLVEGVNNIAISATDLPGNIGNAGLTVSMYQTLTITSTPVTIAKLGLPTPYAYDVNAYDPDGQTLTYELLQAPTGMTINATTGLINWTPTAVGSEDVTVKVSDGFGESDQQTFTITVTINQRPRINSFPSFTANVGITYAYQISVIDPDNSVFTYTLISAPTGMTIDANGLIQWTPASTFGTASIMVEVDDGDGGTVQQEYIICE